jgi:hypothetical protein
MTCLAKKVAKKALLFFKDKMFVIAEIAFGKSAMREKNFKDYTYKTFSEIDLTVRARINCLLPENCRERINYCLKKLAHRSIVCAVEEADAVCDHKIRLFEEINSFENNINWHRDYISGYQWPLKYHKSIDFINSKDDSDIKFTWEINRFHHAVILGKAYFITGDEKYAEEFVGEVNSWIDENPYDRGINWACSMELAIRAINLIWAYCFFVDSRSLSNEFRIKYYNTMLLHGTHIFANLENRGHVRNNHYVANLLGLLYLGEIFPVFKASKRWSFFAIAEIGKEMKSQVHADGTSFECSIPYHRFATEMFFHAASLLIHIEQGGDDKLTIYKEAGRLALGYNYIDKLEKMFEFIIAYSGPDSLAPQIGDNDGGRVIVLGNNRCDSKNHLYMLALAGEFFDRDDFRSASREYCEDAIWVYGGAVNPPVIAGGTEVSSIAYKDSGIFIMREGRDYLIVHCGDLGTGGKGTHNHNDNLSFELCADGIKYLVDPGTYTYSRDPKMRNLLRSTRYHNTLIIDGEEQNNIIEHDLFSLEKNINTSVIAWKSSKEADEFIGEIEIRPNVEHRVMHRREIRFDKVKRTWNIKDRVMGQGVHELVWNFHLRDGLRVERKNDNVIVIWNDQHSALRMEKDLNMTQMKICNGWYSKGYGKRTEASMLSIMVKSCLPIEMNCEFSKVVEI